MVKSKHNKITKGSSTKKPGRPVGTTKATLSRPHTANQSRLTAFLSKHCTEETTHSTQSTEITVDENIEVALSSINDLNLAMDVEPSSFAISENSSGLDNQQQAYNTPENSTVRKIIIYEHSSCF